MTRTVCLCFIALVAQAKVVAAFEFSTVRERARTLSLQPFRPLTNRVPEVLQKLTYLQHQRLQFRAQNALWAREALPFQIEFFLPGSVHRDTVVLHEVTDEGVNVIPFRPDAFSLGTNGIKLPADLQYAGFRITHSVAGFGEVASFLGASYFRMVGRGQAFGSSSRGLALDTVLLEKEEFPAFREFWFRKPAKDDSFLKLWALLDSTSVAGAFEFTVKPGVTTVADVRAAFFPRRQVAQFGVAPLTSMFLHDENSHQPWSDFRPEVHDADGLLIHSGQETMLWRPLESGKMMRVNAYQELSPKGFGLMQRERDFEQYQDLIARFEARPSLWVKPLSNWGQGSVQLVQLPTDVEYTDNVVAFWVPASLPTPGQSLELTYQIHWTTNLMTPPSLGYVRSTRVGKVDGSTSQAPNLRFVIDFGGSAMERLPATEQLEADVTCGEGTRFIADTVLKNPVNATWRLVLEIAAPSRAVDLKALLKRRGQPVTETWTFTWQP